MSTGSQLVRFLFTYVLGVPFNFATTAVEALGAGPLAAQALCLPVVAVFSFLLFKFQVFRDRP